MTTQRSRYLFASVALAAALTAGACAAGDSDEAGSGLTAAEPAASRPENPGAEEADAGGKAADPARQVKDAVEPQSQAVIRTGTVSLKADDVGDARFDVQKIIDRAGGSVVEQETTTDDDGALDTARIVLRVPVEQFQDTMDALERVASLESSDAGEDDVTTEVIDVDARIRAQERSVRRIETLLAQATTLRDIISIEAELSQRQADLDSLKSRQQWLDDQTDRSTITVHLERADADDADEKTEDGFLGGLRAGWDSFVDGVAVALTVIGFLLPWTIALAVILVPVLLWLRATRRRRTPVPTAGP